MSSRSAQEKAQICFGVIYVLAGFVCIPSVVAAWLGTKGVTDVMSVRVLLWTVSTALIGWGILTLAFRRREWVGNLNLMFILAGVLLVVSEVGLRVRAWHRYGIARTTVTDSLLVYHEQLSIAVPRPGYKNHGSKTSVRINSLGFRSDEITVEKPPNTLRIACVGGSTTFCTETSSNSATWPAQLQRALRGRYPKVHIQVINAGVQGYKAADSLKNLRHRVLPLQPDLVIVHHANNDIAYDTRRLARQQGLVKVAESPMGGVVKFLSKVSLVFDLAMKNVTIAMASRPEPLGKLATISQDLPTRFINVIGQIHADLDRQGVPLVLSTFLVKYRRDQPRDVQIANAGVSFYYMPWMTIDGLLDAMDLYKRATLQYAREHSVMVVEDNESIPGDDAHFADFTHLTDRGCALMAERMMRFFEESKVIDDLIKNTQPRD